MTVFPVLSDQIDKADAIEHEMQRVFDAATKEVALAREQIRRAEDALSELEWARWLRRCRRVRSLEP